MTTPLTASTTALTALKVRPSIATRLPQLESVSPEQEMAVSGRQASEAADFYAASTGRPTATVDAISYVGSEQALGAQVADGHGGYTESPEALRQTAQAGGVIVVQNFAFLPEKEQRELSILMSANGSAQFIAVLSDSPSNDPGNPVAEERNVPLSPDLQAAFSGAHVSHFPRPATRKEEQQDEQWDRAHWNLR